MPQEADVTYNPALDGLRAIAVLMVVAFHCRLPGASGGFYGVDVFFVLSGYLITRLLAGELDASGRIDLRCFYWNRFLRLMPTLALVVAVILGLGLVTPGKALVAAAYLTDIVAPFDRDFGILSHTWSLSVEEHFYLIWPLVLPLILGARRPFHAAIALWVVLTIWRATWYPLAPEHATYYRFDLRLTGLVLGSALALSKWRIPAPGGTRLALSAVAVLAVAVATTKIFSWRSLVTVQPTVELASAIVVLAVASGVPLGTRLLSAKLLVLLGRWSYGIYLWHFPIAFVLRDQYSVPAAAVLTLVASVSLAAATHSLLELPMRRFRIEAQGRLQPQASGCPSARATATGRRGAS